MTTKSGFRRQITTEIIQLFVISEKNMTMKTIFIQSLAANNMNNVYLFYGVQEIPMSESRVHCETDKPMSYSIGRDTQRRNNGNGL